MGNISWAQITFLGARIVRAGEARAGGLQAAAGVPADRRGAAEECDGEGEQEGAGQALWLMNGTAG